MINQYPYAEIGPNVYEINEFDNVSMFLVVGKKRRY